jgi:hypothetical protein
MKLKELHITKEAFNNIYGNDYLKGKYGSDWVDIIVTDLKRAGTVVKFVQQKQIEAKKELKELESINKINL